jgi:Family of unknown function (DUF6228)
MIGLVPPAGIEPATHGLGIVVGALFAMAVTCVDLRMWLSHVIRRAPRLTVIRRFIGHVSGTARVALRRHPYWPRPPIGARSAVAARCQGWPQAIAKRRVCALDAGQSPWRIEHRGTARAKAWIIQRIMADSLTIRYPPADGAWLLHPPSDPWGDGYIIVMPVELHADGLSARQTVELAWQAGGEQPDLVSYFDDLADHWRGWQGDRTWRSLDGSMRIAASHDGQGHVALVGTLMRDSFSADSWLARVCLTVEAGEQMRSLAADVRAHFADMVR